MTEKKEHNEKKHGKSDEPNYWKYSTIVLIVLLVGVIIYQNVGSQPEAGDETPVLSDEPKVELLIVNDKECALCDTTEIVQAIEENLFPNLVTKEIDYKSEAGQKYVGKYDIKAVPAYIFGSSVKETSGFVQISEAMVEVDGKYMIDPATLGSGKLLNPPEEGNDPVKGEADAPVTIIEFSEYQCPFCGKYASETLPSIREQYIETGKVRYVFKDFPLSFHDNAQKASEAAECAGEQDTYWEMHDLLFENQDALSVDDLKDYAVELGLDSEQFDECLDSGKYEDEVKQDMAEGQKYGVSGTPAFFINGIMLTGAQPFEAFQAVIDSELGVENE